MFTGQNGANGAAGKSQQDAMSELWTQSIKFTSGTGVVYKPNVLVLDQKSSPLARNVIVGSVSNREPETRGLTV
jgi:hypothetical protein